MLDSVLIRCEVDSDMEPSDYNIIGIGCDVSSELSVQQAYRRVMDRYGRIDSVVASAGASLQRHVVVDPVVDSPSYTYRNCRELLRIRVSPLSLVGPMGGR